MQDIKYQNVHTHIEWAVVIDGSPHQWYFLCAHSPIMVSQARSLTNCPVVWIVGDFQACHLARIRSVENLLHLMGCLEVRYNWNETNCFGILLFPIHPRAKNMQLSRKQQLDRVVLMFYFCFISLLRTPQEDCTKNVMQEPWSGSCTAKYGTVPTNLLLFFQNPLKHRPKQWIWHSCWINK